MFSTDSIKAVFKQGPELFLGIIGLALCLVPLESYRLTTLTGIYPVELSLVFRHAFTFLVLAGVFIAYQRKHAFRLGRKTLTTSILAVLFSACLMLKYQYYFFGSANAVLETVGSVCEPAAGTLLILVWGEALLPYGLKRCIICIASTFLVTAAIQTSLSFVQQVPSMFFIALMPLLSVVAFSYFKTTKKLSLIENHREYLNDDLATKPSEQPNDLSLGKYLMPLLFVVLFCILYVIGNILFQSLVTQQEISSSPVSQLGIGGGTALAGIFLLFSTEFFESRLALPVYALFFLSLLAITIYLTNVLSGPLIAGYLLLANALLKLTVALIWILPFFAVKAGTSYLAIFSFGYLLSSFAKTCSTLSMLAQESFGIDLFGVLVGLALIVLLTCSVLLFIIVNQSTSTIPADVAPLEQNKTPFRNVMSQLKDKYNLTPQEAKIISLVAQGHNVKYISEKLVITSNTTKSHMRNIYTKLDIHTQQDLINIVDSYVQQEKNSTK